MDPSSHRSDETGHAEFCQSCGALAPTKHVKFYRNIGAIILMFPKAVEGNFCRSCINRYFWDYTLFTFLLGWWCPPALIFTPFFLLSNIVRYIGTLGMGGVPDAMSSQLTWLKGMPMNLRPDPIRAAELERFRTQNNILHNRFLELVMQSPGTTKTLIEQRFEFFKQRRPSATDKQIFTAVILDTYLLDSISQGMTPAAARALVQEPWVEAKVVSAVERIETLNDLTRYIVEEYQDFWNRTPDALGTNARIADILGYHRQYPTPRPLEAKSS